MKRILVAFAACAALVASPAFSQERTAALAPSATEAAAWPADLPKGEMKGTWNWEGFAGGSAMNGKWSLTIEAFDPATGALEGKLSFQGNTCNARNARATGTYKDGILTVNADRGPQCHNQPFVLAKKDKPRFEGRYALGNGSGGIYSLD